MHPPFTGISIALSQAIPSSTATSHLAEGSVARGQGQGYSVDMRPEE